MQSKSANVSLYSKASYRLLPTMKINTSANSITGVYAHGHEEMSSDLLRTNKR